MSLASLATKVRFHYRRQRHLLAQRVMLTATSPMALAAVGGLLGYRTYAKSGGNPYDLVETGALLLAVPVLWATGRMIRDYYGRG